MAYIAMYKIILLLFEMIFLLFMIWKRHC